MKMDFHADETLVSCGRNFSFIREKLQFHLGETFVPRGGETLVSPCWNQYLLALRQQKVPVAGLRGLTDVRLTRGLSGELLGG